MTGAAPTRQRARIVMVWLLLGTALLLGSQAGFAAGNEVFRAGACAVDITPTNFPVIINGGFLASKASKANDPLHARCLVLDDGVTRVGLCVIDSCLIPREWADQAKALIHEATGIPPERLMLAATHTHFAPSLMQALGTPPDPNYPAFLLPRVVEGFRRAVSQLAPARIGWASTPAPDYTHTRVWIRRPDRLETDPFGQRTVRANMHPGHQNPDTIGPSGPSDPELSVVSIQSLDGRPMALLANYAMHYHGGTAAVSADYYGRFAEKMSQLIGSENAKPPFVAIMSQGYSGDQHWMDYSKPAEAISLDRYAGELARLAYEVSQRIQYQASAAITMKDQDLPLPVRMPDSARLAWARGVVESMQGREPKTLPEVYAREQLWLEAHPVVKVKLQVLRIGELGITGVSGEVFAITSLKLKAQSPLRALFNIELANGEEGYIPPPAYHKLGGYNTWACRTACLEENADPKIVDTLLGMLEDVAGQPRQKPTDPLGIYTQSLLRAEPLAYWRMNEWSGPEARDATRNQRAARYEDGVVFYLDGPASPAFSGAETLNRAPHFAGGRMLAPLAHPGEQYSIELWFWNGLPPRIRGVAGYLCAWGDRLAIGGTNGASGQLMVSNGAQGEVLTGANQVPLKKWTHLTLTRDGRKVVVYMNGAPEIIGELPLPKFAAANSLYIGGRDEPAESFEGKIDEVAVYDRPLGAAEVIRHVQLAGLAMTGPVLAKVEPDPLGAYSLAVLNAKPQAYWRLDDNGFSGLQALDRTPNRQHGVYEEEIELYQLGPTLPGPTSGSGTNHAARFTGGRLRATMTGLGPAYTVSFWFWNRRPNNVSPVTGYLFSRGPDGGDGAPGDHLGIGGTHLNQAGHLIFYNGNALGQVLCGQTVIQPGAWNQVTLVRAGKKVRVYLNGNAEPEIAGEAEVSPQANSEEIFVGGRNDNFANFYGLIDEVAIYNRALSSEDTRRLFQAAHAQTATNPNSNQANQ